LAFRTFRPENVEGTRVIAAGRPAADNYLGEFDCEVV